MESSDPSAIVPGHSRKALELLERHVSCRKQVSRDSPFQSWFKPTPSWFIIQKVGFLFRNYIEIGISAMADELIRHGGC